MENVIYIICHLIMTGCCFVLAGVALSFKLDNRRAKKHKRVASKVKEELQLREFETTELKPKLKLATN